MKRRLGYLAFLVALLAIVAVSVLQTAWTPAESQQSLKPWVLKGLLALAIGSGTYGVYLLLSAGMGRLVHDRRRRHDLRNVVRLVLVIAAIIAVAGVLTDQWLGVLFSLGIVGFGVTVALQQPLTSLLGWVYILSMRPYQVGDRIRIEDAKGDVIDVDFLVTTLWEVEGDLVSSHQPSGRTVTVPNSLILTSEVFNYSRDDFPFVWSEVSMQVSYETDLDFARSVMRAVADEQLGDEMERNVATYREQLAETPVDLEVQDRPSVNVAQGETWVELRLRFLTRPRQIQRTKNALYEEILARFQANPDKVAFPVGRFR
ncbi:mechanosensitive ion channel family protein [Haloarchaeobius litoreus]|uniref:Mechanosensitive ion channel family protein n=1 Tax=Haloarchaeobius litoreus TaxID=755306 RepID=A0ABD6DF96_9EURY